MNTFWLKIAGLAVLVLVVIVAVNVLSPSGSEPKAEHQPQTLGESAARDRNKFLAKPKPVETGKQESGTSGRQSTRHLPKPHKTVTLYFKVLSEIDKIEAERFLDVAVPGRSIGRLPMTGFTLMVPNCRRIIERWPDSWYAYRARQMLADIPRRFRSRYHITEEEIDLSRYSKPRPGTKPFTVEASK